MKITRTLLISILAMIIVGAGSYPGLAEQSECKKTFLLEAGAVYEVSVLVKSGIQAAPTTALVYILGEHGEYLRSTQLSGTLAATGKWEKVSTAVAAPPGALQATVVFTAPAGAEMQWADLNIRRIEPDSDHAELIKQGLVYTGLIVDARGLDLQRGMSPRIYSESGQLIYAGVTAAYDFWQKEGIVSYGQELSPELLRRIQPEESVTVSPLVVKALKTTGSASTSVVISNDDAHAILRALNIYDFLAEYSVVFLVD